MALPEIINFNGQQITRDAFMMMRCYTKEDLRNWIKLFVNIDLPDCIVSENSNSSPMDMVWWIYQRCVIDRDVVGSRAIFMANRSGFKTLTLSIAELLAIIHGDRDVAHIGAIEAQAARCYSYFTKYMWQEEFKHFIDSDPTMKKTTFKTGRTVEIIPCSIAQVNGPHTSLVCIGGDTQILVANSDNQVVSVSARKLYKLINRGLKINAISYNHKSQLIEPKPITHAYDSGKKERLKIVTNAKRPLWCTPDHKLFDPVLGEYKPAKDFRVGDVLMADIDRGAQIQKIIPLKTKCAVYDFTVAGNHNFFAGGVLVKNCLDETDTVRDMQAYRDISGIPSLTMDGRPPVEVSISTRKSTFGLMQQEIDNAHRTNTQVFSWNVIDITKQCPDSRSLTEKMDIYVNFDTLEAINEATFSDRPITEKINFEKRQGYKGCLSNCKLFSCCLGSLKNQKSTSTLLRDIEYTQADIFKRSLDYTIAQLLCRKPSTEGTIYSTYSYKQNVKTFNQIYEIFMGEVPTKQITFEDMHFEFTKRGIFPFVGVDPGDQMAAVLLIYIDGARRVYILKEQAFTATDDNELALWIKNNWGSLSIQMIYSDVANPSAIRLMIKQDLPVSKKVDKDVHAGLSTVRSFLRIPGTNRTGLFIHENCTNLIDEMPRYHFKKTASDMISKDPDKQDDHFCDSLRMVLHSIFGGQNLNVSSVIPPGSVKTEPGEEVLRTSEGNYTRVPSAKELAEQLGIPNFVDNTADVIVQDEDPSKKPLKGTGFDVDWNW